MRTPMEARLEQIAKFFGKSMEFFCRDIPPPAPAAPLPPASANPAEMPTYLSMSMPELLIAMGRERIRAVYQVEITVSAVRFLPCGANGREEE